MLTAVTFDCWNTLLAPYDERGAAHVRVAALVDELGLSEDEARVEVTEGWQRHHDSWLRAESFVSRHIVEWLLTRHGRADDVAVRERLTKVFEEASLTNGPRATPYAAEVLSSLRDAGLGVAVVCDSGFSPGRVIREMFRGAGLYDLVDVWAFSDEVDACKPRPEMFACALDGLGVTDPSTALHVGDLWRTDVCGGRAYGMATARYTGVFDDPPPPGEPDADLVVDDHRAVGEAAIA